MLRKFIKYYKPYKKLFFFDIMASLLISLVGICYPILTKTMLADFIPNKDVKFIVIFGCLLLVLYFIRMGLKYFVESYGHIMGLKMQADMRRELFVHLEKLPYSFYDENETGKVMSRMTNDLWEVSELAHHGPENLLICSSMLVGTFIYLSILNWLLSLIILLCIPFLVIISVIYRKKMRNAFLESRKDVAIINGQLESSISGIRVTKAFTNSKREEEKFEIGNQSFVKSRSKAFKSRGQFVASTNFIIDAFNVILLISGGILITKDMLDFASFSAFIVAVNLFIGPLTTLINFSEQYQNGVTGFNRFQEIMDEKVEYDIDDSVKFDKIRGNIEFKNVCFKYRGDQEVINNVSLSIKAGDKIALVGPSGGGKTTICHLIPRFYLIDEGEILIDGVNINDISAFTLRKNIGIVQQDVFLFNGTFLDNILYGKLDATFDEVIEAAKNANIHDFIMSLPNGYETEIGERGVKLSGGQKQRLSIARVFLKNPSILILDEATSALDNTTEILIQEALDRLAQNRTSIIVAHRLSTIKNALEIVVVSDGVIKEKGSHEQLMKENGIYKNLYELQFIAK